MKKSSKFNLLLQCCLGAFIAQPFSASAAPPSFGPGSPQFSKIAEDGTLMADFDLASADQIKEVKATANGSLVEKTTFTPFPDLEDRSVSTVFLLDVSNTSRASAISAGKSQIRKLITAKSPSVGIAIATVYQDVAVISTFGSNDLDQEKKLTAIEPDPGKGNTRLYSGIRTVILDQLKAQSTKRKAIVLLSDGKDEEFQKDPAAGFEFREELVRLAHENGVTIHIIGYPEADSDVGALEPFRILARETGGSYYQCTPKTYEPVQPDLHDSFWKHIQNGGRLLMSLPKSDKAQEIRITVQTESGEILTSSQTIEPFEAPAQPDPVPAPEPDPAFNQAGSETPISDEGSQEPASSKKQESSDKSEAAKSSKVLGLNRDLFYGLLAILAIVGGSITFLLIRRSHPIQPEINPIDDDPLDSLLASESGSVIYQNVPPAPANTPNVPALPLAPSRNQNLYQTTEEKVTYGVLRSKKNSQNTTLIQQPIFTVGRSKMADLTIGNDSVSNVHALIFVKNEKTTTLIDLHSANGIFVNGSKVDKGCDLHHGDHVEFGEVAYTFEVQN